MTSRRFMSIMFGRDARVRLAVQRSEREKGIEAPLRWYELLDQLSRDHAGRSVEETSMWHVFSGSARHFAWQPTRDALLATLGRGGLTYLCWGFPVRGGWRDRRLAMILQQATQILVNDEVTKAEVEDRIQRDAQVVPFFVDMEFFAFSPLPKREDFLFCNGANDRDPELLLALAQRGHNIVWLTNDDGLFQRYQGRHANLSLRRNVPYRELRELYQTCRANIMPALRDTHCAGQTTGMEAIACGAPVVISAGRTADIFADLSSVSVVDDKSLDSWDAAVRYVSDNADEVGCQAALQASRDQLARRISVASLTVALAPVFNWLPAGLAQNETLTVR